MERMMGVTTKTDNNIIVLDTDTMLDIPPSRVLNAAQEKDLDGVVVIGYTKDGEEYFASSISDDGTVIWLFERCKKELLEMVDD